MKKFSILISLIFVYASALSAQTTPLKLCYNSKTKALSALATCTTGTTQLTGGNIQKVLGLSTSTSDPKPTGTSSGINYSKCYKQIGSGQGSPSNGQVGVALSCKAKTDVMIASGFSTDDNSQSLPSLSSQTIIFAGSVPNGIQLETTGKQNLFYKLNATITCCPNT